MANGASLLDLAQSTAVRGATQNTALTGGPWQAITALAATTVTLTATNWNGGTQITGLAIPVGATIYGNFTAITPTSASPSIVAYQLLQ